MVSVSQFSHWSRYFRWAITRQGDEMAPLSTNDRSFDGIDGVVFSGRDDDVLDADGETPADGIVTLEWLLLLLLLLLLLFDVVKLSGANDAGFDSIDFDITDDSGWDGSNIRWYDSSSA